MLLDTEAEETFDRLTAIAREMLEADVSLISLVDADRQFFKSEQGLQDPWAQARETPLSHSFCKRVVADDAALVIDDARDDPALADHLAVRDLGIVAYAGVPLRLSTGTRWEASARSAAHRASGRSATCACSPASATRR